MKVSAMVDTRTDRTDKLTIIADSFPEERLLSLIVTAMDRGGTMTIESGDIRITWELGDAKRVR